MNAIIKTVMTIEHHCLQLPYASLRLHPRHRLDRLVLSMESQGQLVPVVVVPSVPNQWVLMDGYLRVNALRRVGKDSVDAEVWDCELAQALLMLLTEHQSRTWDVFEEALLLQELHIHHGFSQNSLATRIGRDKSWVNRRLALLDNLSEPILQAITREKLSVWSATRIVAPLARANVIHGKCLLSYLLENFISTRDLKFFYDHYQRSNHQQRSNMVNDPGLFFKAQKLLAVEKQTKTLQAGPEGKWHSQLSFVRHTLASLIPLASHLFAPHPETHERIELINALHSVQTQFDLLTETVRGFVDVNKRHAADNYQSASKRE